MSPSAIRDLDRLPPRVIPSILDLLYGPLAENPHRLGKPLRGKFERSFSARRGDFRVLYETDDDAREIRVYRISGRADAYR